MESQEYCSKKRQYKAGPAKTIFHQPNKETDIMGIPETWLDEFTDGDIKIDGYLSERVDWKDRNLSFDKDRSGSVLIYISYKLSYTRRDDLETNNVESI